MMIGWDILNKDNSFSFFFKLFRPLRSFCLSNRLSAFCFRQPRPFHFFRPTCFPFSIALCLPFRPFLSPLFFSFFRLSFEFRLSMFSACPLQFSVPLALPRFYPPRPLSQPPLSPRFVPFVPFSGPLRPHFLPRPAEDSARG